MVKYSDKTKGERIVITYILLKQIIILFMLMGVGAALYKLKYITDQGAKEFGNVLLRIIIPSVIIKSYIVEFTPEKFRDMWMSTGLALLGLLLAMAVSENRLKILLHHIQMPVLLEVLLLKQFLAVKQSFM